MSLLRFARPSLLDAIPPRGHAVIEASAGTGKTYTLEHLVVELLVRGASLDRILVVTFTEKATREMRARVRATLGAIVSPLADDPRVDPAQGPVWTLDEPTRARLAEAFVGFERAPISTIHGFCQRVLAEQAFLSRRPFRQTLVEPRRAFGRAFREELRVVLADASPLRAVVLRVLASMDADDLEGALFPWHVERGAIHPVWDRDRFAAALARMPRRTDLAALERIVRVAFARVDVASRVLEALASLAALVDDAFSRLGSDEDGALLDALVALDTWSRTEVVRGEPLRAWLPARLEGAAMTEPALADVLGKIGALLDVATSPFGVLVQELLPRVRERLRTTKAREGTIDFDDMLGLVAEALEGPGSAGLVASLRAQYSHALVDEFQDTDELQWSIFRRLFVDGTNEHSLYVIGDPKQAIYGFRNADVHTYEAACTRLSAGRAPLRLVECFRSTARVIGAYNQVFADDFFRGSIRYDEPVRAGDPTRRAMREDGRDLPAMTLWTVVGDEKPSADEVRATLGEAIARECLRLVEEEKVELVERGERRRLGYSDVFVLTRTAREAEVLAEALERNGVPHAFYKREGLFRTREATEVLDVLRAVADPADASARLRAWLTAFFDVPLASLPACRDLDAQHPLVSSLYRWRELAERHDGAGLLRAMLEESGLARRLLFRAGGEVALTTYQHVLEVLLEESGGRRSADDLAARLDAFVRGRAEPLHGEGSVQRLSSDRPAVQLLTMHKSKGLEAAVVFLAGGFTRGGGGGATEPLVAHRDGRREAWVRPVPREVEARVDEEARAEDERLLYVALTRAKARLYVPYFGAPPAGGRTLACHERFGPVQGPHRWLDERLAALVARGFVDGDAVTWEPLAVEAPEAPARPRKDVPWELVDPVLAAASPAEDFDRLRREHAGFVVTSYTRMAKRGATAPTWVANDEEDELVEELAAEAVWTPGAGMEAETSLRDTALRATESETSLRDTALRATDSETSLRDTALRATETETEAETSLRDTALRATESESETERSLRDTALRATETEAETSLRDTALRATESETEAESALRATALRATESETEAESALRATGTDTESEAESALRATGTDTETAVRATALRATDTDRDTDTDTDTVELPGGATIGIFLHAALESLFAPGHDVARLLEGDAPRARAIVEQAARRSLVDAALVPTAQALVTRALRTPLACGALTLPRGLAGLDGPRVPEMSFAYPVPERSHPGFVAATDASEEAPSRATDTVRPFRIERGVLRGVIDLVLTHDARTYFLDWKSDRLPSFDPPVLLAHVEQHYALQARLYTLGVARLLAIRDRDGYERSFGGLLYCFLRGMDPVHGPNAGVSFLRPSWDEVVAWERELRDSDTPFGYAWAPLPEAPT